MRKAFTLLELMVVVAIIAGTLTIGMMSISGSQKAVRTKGAARDIFALIRHARSTALVTQQPAIITYSCVIEDGEPMAKVEITSAKLLDTASTEQVTSLSGDPIVTEESETPATETESQSTETEATASSGGGETVEEILFAPVSTEVVRGLRLKVVLGDDELEASPVASKPRLSVFSNVDYLLGRFGETKKSQSSEGETDASGSAETADELQSPVSVVWETNGRVEPHQVWIYADGSEPESGLSLRVDRFGGTKVLGGGEDDDE